MQQTVGDHGPLNGKAGDQKVVTHRGETILFKKGHEKTKTNENHHVNVLVVRINGRVFTVALGRSGGGTIAVLGKDRVENDQDDLAEKEGSRRHSAVADHGV